MPTDKERLDWLQKQDGYALLSDDAGHWAVTVFGIQTVPIKTPCNITGSYAVLRKEWCKTVRKALDKAMKENPE